MHTPVFLEEVVEILDIEKGMKILDATFGEGGHSKQIAERGATVLAIDVDEKAVQEYSELSKIAGIQLVQGNFKDLKQIAASYGFVPVDRVLFDFGLSMSSYTKRGIGLSYLAEAEPLDMRLSGELTQTAEDIITSYSKEQLYEIFARYSQDINSRSIAESIVRARHIKSIDSVGALNACIKECVSTQAFEQTARKIFQALYIVVNDELGAIESGLQQAVEIVKPGGKILTIGFHAGHERAIKQVARTNGLRAKKVEIHRPLRSFERSATLRIIEKNI